MKGLRVGVEGGVKARGAHLVEEWGGGSWIISRNRHSKGGRSKQGCFRQGEKGTILLDPCGILTKIC